MALASDAGMSQGAYFLFDRKKKWNRILEKECRPAESFGGLYALPKKLPCRPAGRADRVLRTDGAAEGGAGGAALLGGAVYIGKHRIRCGIFYGLHDAVRVLPES